MAKKVKIENGKVYTSEDGVTWVEVGDATPEQIKQYEYAKAEKAAGYKESEAYGPKGLAKLNELRANVNMSPATDVRQGIKELQEYSGKNYDALVTDYMINRSPKPNARLQKKLEALKYEPTKEGAKKAFEEGKLSKEDVVDAYKDSQFWFRAIAPKKVKVSREEYDRLLKRPGAVKQGDSAFFVEDPNKPQEYTEYVPEDPPAKDQTVTLPQKAADVVKDPFKRNPITDIRKKAYAPWWLQDIVKTSGAAADLARVKKYEPWQDTPQVFLPNATYYDPTRELAANTEQANLASQFHQAFTGPKSGAISGVQGKALDNAANIMAKYNNLNVGLANQLSHERANILNQASQNKAGLNTQLFDKYTIANQQFDNSKNMARQNLRQSYMDAITNRAKTQALNTMYPNYYTDPSMGGFMNFNPGYGPITPNQPSDEFAKIDDIIKRYPGTSFEAASKYLKGDRSDNDPNSNLDPYLKAQGYGNTLPG
jgi:hypothetical protein